MENKLIFVVQGYELQTPEGGLMDSCTFEIFAKSEKDAIEKAKKIIKKKFYRISGVIEK